MLKFNQPLTTNWIAAFVIGLLSAFPSLAPTALSLKAKKECELYQKADFETKYLWVPIAYGFLLTIVVWLINTLLPKNLRNYWVLGFIMALIFPTLGTIGDYAKKIYGIESYWSLYFNAQIMYLSFYGLVINYIFSNIC